MTFQQHCLTEVKAAKRYHKGKFEAKVKPATVFITAPGAVPQREPSKIASFSSMLYFWYKTGA